MVYLLQEKDFFFANPSWQGDCPSAIPGALESLNLILKKTLIPMEQRDHVVQI